MAKNDLVYLRHILDAIEKIEEYLIGISEKDFGANTLVQDGVIRQLEIIGEATKHISKEVRQLDNTVPWQDISDMRNKLIHDYFGVDVDIVWTTAKEDIPDIKLQIVALLKENSQKLK